MDNLTRDEIIYMALLLDLPDILSLCESSTRLNQIVCQNQKFWMNKILIDFPDKNIKEYGPDFKESYQKLAYTEIYISITINVAKEEGDEVDDEIDEEVDQDEDNFYYHGDSKLKVRKNLSPLAVQTIIQNAIDDFFRSLSIWGYFTLNIDGDAECQDDKWLSLDCYKNVDTETRHVEVYFDATEDFIATELELSRSLSESIDYAKKIYYDNESK